MALSYEVESENENIKLEPAQFQTLKEQKQQWQSACLHTQSKNQ